MNLIQYHTAIFQMRMNRIEKSFRLFHDFLEHKMLITVFFCRMDIPVNLFGFLFDRHFICIENLYTVPFDHGNFIIFQTIDISRLVEDSRYIRGYIVFFFTQTDNQRTFLSDGNDLIRIITAEDSQRIGTVQFGHHTDDGVHDVTLIIVFKQLGDHFCIRIGTEGQSSAHQHFTQKNIVFDDTIMHHGKASGFTQMRMGIDIRRLSMCCPSCVADSDRTMQYFSVIGQVF